MIGVFDSGVGGLTAVKQIYKYLPGYDVVYFGDTARVPYGTKTIDTVRKYALEDANFLLSQGAKIILIACNTASAVAYDALNGEYPVPVLDIIMPGVKAALKTTRNGKVGVVGTKTTVKTRTHENFINRLDPSVKVFYQATPVLVSIAENNTIRTEVVRLIVEDYLEPLLSEGIDTLILGCTHFPYFTKVFQEVVGDGVKLIDPAEEAAKDLIKLMESDSVLSSALSTLGENRFFVSDLPEAFIDNGSKFMQEIENEEVIKVDIENIMQVSNNR